MPTIKTIERRLDNAIAYAESQGFRLKPHVTLDERRKLCCPLGAVKLQQNLNHHWTGYDVALWMGLESGTAFQLGFDGCESHEAPELHALGLKYRERALQVPA